MAYLVPVDYDPFASPQRSSESRLVPVDYDPFAAPPAPPGPEATVRPRSGRGDYSRRMVQARDSETTIAGHLAEVPGGVAAGAVGAVGTALRGVAALSLVPAKDRFGAYIDEVEGMAGETDDESAQALESAIKDDPDMHGWQRSLLSGALHRLRSTNPVPRRAGAGMLRYARRRLQQPELAEHPFWRAGESVSEWAEETFPAGEGYEESLGREVGMGLGSLGVGVAASVAGGPAGGMIAGGMLFTAMGAGEAADRAVAAGASDEEIVRASTMGMGAGATDILPVEVLLRRLPVPGVRIIAEAVRRFGGERVARAIGRTGMQATVEAVQEGGQQALQNLIAREVHSPETVIMEGVEHGAGIGGIVGGIAGLTREGITGIAGRRSRSAHGARAKAVEDVPPPSPEDEASPIPTADIIEGREIVADAMAVDGVNQVLGEQGMPPIGTPVRLVRGGEAIEGVVTDAWSGEDPGLTMEAPSGDVIDITEREIVDVGAHLEVLPMPAAKEDIDKRRKEISTEAERVTTDLERLAEKDAKKAEKERERVGEQRAAPSTTEAVEPAPVSTPVEPGGIAGPTSPRVGEPDDAPPDMGVSRGTRLAPPAEPAPAVREAVGQAEAEVETAPTVALLPDIAEPSGDSGSADAQVFGDSAMAQAVRTEGFESLDRNSQHMVLSNVSRAIRDKPEVAQIVVESIPVDVMDNLAGPEMTADDLLRDQTMLASRLSVSRNVPVRKAIVRVVDNLASSLEGVEAGLVAKESILPSVRDLAPKRGTAVGTGAQRGLVTGAGTERSALPSDAVGRALETPATSDAGKVKDGHVDVSIAGQTDTVDINPSEAQKEAGSYKKGHIRLHGMDISIENPRGSERSGVGKDGKPWSVKMPASYGYVRRTEGADGEQVDVYVGPEPESDQVFVVDQVDADTQDFDEHKAMLGYPSKEAAIADYEAAFDDGRGSERRGAVTPMSARAFRNGLQPATQRSP